MGELDPIRREASTATAPPPSAVAPPPPSAVAEPNSDSDVEEEDITGYIEEMMNQLMAHQKTLHDKFIGKLEDMDRKRQVVDEEWRQMFTERRALMDFFKERDKSISAEREDIIFSYMEKATGQNFSLPPRNPAAKPISPRISDQRWPDVEVDRLIDIRAGLEPRFNRSGSNYLFWEEISRLMAESGFRRTAIGCKKKWESTNKYFKRLKKNSSPRKRAKTWPHYKKLDQLHSKSSAGCSTSDANGGIDPASVTGDDQANAGKEKEEDGKI